MPGCSLAGGPATLLLANSGDRSFSAISESPERSGRKCRQAPHSLTLPSLKFRHLGKVDAPQDAAFSGRLLSKGLTALADRGGARSSSISNYELATRRQVGPGMDRRTASGGLSQRSPPIWANARAQNDASRIVRPLLARSSTTARPVY